MILVSLKYLPAQHIRFSIESIDYLEFKKLIFLDDRNNAENALNRAYFELSE